MSRSAFKNILMGITYALLLFFALFRFSDILGALQTFLGILFPFLLGAGLAFILNIPLSFIEKKLLKGMDRPKLRRWKRPLSMLITILIFLTVILLIGLLIVPEIVRTVGIIANTIPNSVDKLQKWLQSKSIGWDKLKQYTDKIDESLKQSGSSLFSIGQGVFGNFFSSAFIVISSVAKTIMNLVISIIFALSLLFSKEAIGVQIKRLLFACFSEKVSRKVLEIARLTSRTFSHFFTGQCIEVLILGSMFLVMMSILRMPYVLLISIIITVTALIPIFGSFIGCILGTLLILIYSPIQAVEFLVLFLILQQIEGNLVYPRVVGGSIGLPPILVLIAVTVGGSLFGIIGMILFIPGSSVLYTLYKRAVAKRLKKKKLDKSKWNPA